MKLEQSFEMAIMTVVLSLPIGVFAQTNSNATVQHNLMPVPASVQFLDGRLGVKDFKVAVQGHSILIGVGGCAVLETTPGKNQD
jgi:hypothetical protein